MLAPLALAAFLAAPSHGASAPAPAGLSERERALVARVSEERAVRRVRELCALGPRMGGTESGRKAAEYLEHALTEAGLAAQVVEDSEAWCHAEPSWRIGVRGPGVGKPFEVDSAWPWGFSPRSGGEAPLALESGEGVAWLTDKLPVLRPKSKRPAVILVDGETTPDGRYPALRELPRGDENPYPVFGISKGDGEALRMSLSVGAITLRYSLEAEILRAKPRTVVAVLPARAGAPPGHMLFCAHGDSDSGGPGANDNASGVAIVCEIATAWAAAVHAGEMPAPAREVRFAVWGSEIHSTKDYLARCEADPPLAVVNFDQSGFGSAADQLHIEPDDLPGNRALVADLLAVLADGTGTSGFPKRWATNGSQGGTDSYVFSGSPRFASDARPSLTIYASAWGTPREVDRTPGMPGESWRERDKVLIDHDVHYHSAGDTPRNTTDREPWNMGWAARVALVGMTRWLDGLEPGGR